MKRKEHSLRAARFTSTWMAQIKMMTLFCAVNSLPLACARRRKMRSSDPSARKRWNRSDASNSLPPMTISVVKRAWVQRSRAFKVYSLNRANTSSCTISWCVWELWLLTPVAQPRSSWTRSPFTRRLYRRSLTSWNYRLARTKTSNQGSVSCAFKLFARRSGPSITLRLRVLTRLMNALLMTTTWGIYWWRFSLIILSMTKTKSLQPWNRMNLSYWMNSSGS